MSHDIVIRVPANESLQPQPTVVRRCAIYARVSVSSNAAGLSSLQAQVQACEAYIQAQRAMGWELVAPAYVDDGFSGPRWPVQIPPSVATPNSPRQGQWNYDGSVLMASRLAASLSL